MQNQSHYKEIESTQNNILKSFKKIARGTRFYQVICHSEEVKKI